MAGMMFLCLLSLVAGRAGAPSSLPGRSTVVTSEECGDKHYLISAEDEGSNYSQVLQPVS